MNIERMKQLAGQTQLDEKAVNITAARNMVNILLPHLTKIAHEISASTEGNDFKRMVAQLCADELKSQINNK
jgi:hypothetical protein